VQPASCRWRFDGWSGCFCSAADIKPCLSQVGDNDAPNDTTLVKRVEVACITLVRLIHIAGMLGRAGASDSMLGACLASAAC